MSLSEVKKYLKMQIEERGPDEGSPYIIGAKMAFESVLNHIQELEEKERLQAVNGICQLAREYTDLLALQKFAEATEAFERLQGSHEDFYSSVIDC